MLLISSHVLPVWTQDKHSAIKEIQFVINRIVLNWLFSTTSPQGKLVSYTSGTSRSGDVPEKKINLICFFIFCNDGSAGLKSIEDSVLSLYKPNFMVWFVRHAPRKRPVILYNSWLKSLFLSRIVSVWTTSTPLLNKFNRTTVNRFCACRGFRNWSLAKSDRERDLKPLQQNSNNLKPQPEPCF